MPTATPDLLSITAHTAKEARFEAQRRVSRLDIAPVRVGLIGWAVNLVLRRPAVFPTLEFARFRREMIRQARRSPLSGADIAVVKFRTRLLASTIDARLSKPVTAADIDAVTEHAVAAEEKRRGVTLTSDNRAQVGDAVWKQYADSFGFPAMGRARQVAEAAKFVPQGGPELAARLRELERDAVTALREKPRQR